MTRTSRRSTALLLFLICAAIYIPTAHAISNDVVTADFAAWQVAIDGKRTFTPDELPVPMDHPLRDVWIITNADGQETIGRSSGVIVASIPAYWLVQPDTMTSWPARVTAALITAAAVAMLYLLLSRYLDRRRALLAAGIFAFATPVWSLAADGMWPHTITVVGIIGMAWAAERDRWWLVGLFGGVALWGRLHAALICALLVLGVAFVRRAPRPPLKPVLQAGSTGLLMLALACCWTRWYYGTWNPTAGYTTSVFTDYAGQHAIDLQNQLGMWISPERGILTWTPLIVVLAGALVRSWRQLPDWSRMLLLAGVVYTLVQAYFNRFSGGSTFYPYRLGLEFLASATPALALSAHRMGAVARRLFVPVLVVQTGAIALGALDLFRLTAVDTRKPEALFQLAVAGVFVVVWLFARWTLGRWPSAHLPGPSGAHLADGPA